MPLMAAMLCVLVLAHLVQQCYNAEDTKGEHTHHCKSNGPGLTVIEALDEHHCAENGDEYGNGEEWKFHTGICLLQK
jgi:hypothetical protein